MATSIFLKIVGELNCIENIRDHGTQPLTLWNLVFIHTQAHAFTQTYTHTSISELDKDVKYTLERKRFICTYLFLTALGLPCCGLSLVVVSGGYSSLQYLGFSLPWLLSVQSTSSVVLACRFCCPAAHGIFQDQGLNPWIGRWILNQWTRKAPKVYF